MDELKMTVSGIVPKDGRQNIYVVFEDGKRRAEGCVPDCVITSYTGFEEDEIKMLELYMKQPGEGCSFTCNLICKLP